MSGTNPDYRNKNPGNIDYNPANKWQGQIGKEAGPNGRFAVFSSHEYGIRALAALLTTYYDRHGLRSIRQIINRWAPPAENTTSKYVAQLTGHDPDADLDLHRFEDMRSLVVAIITHELGGQPYPARVIDEGLRLAGLRKSAHSLVSAATTPEGQSALGWAGLATAAATPAPYRGGKRNLARRVVARLQAIPHTTYVEPFVGMGGVFLRRPFKARAEVINDISGDVANLFRILQRHYVPLMDMLRWQLTSRAEFERLQAANAETLIHLERAARFLYLQRLCLGGKVDGRHFGVKPSSPPAST